MSFGIVMFAAAGPGLYNYWGSPLLLRSIYNNGNSFLLFPIRLRGDLFCSTGLSNAKGFNPSVLSRSVSTDWCTRIATECERTVSTLTRTLDSRLRKFVRLAPEFRIRRSRSRAVSPPSMFIDED